MQINHVITDGGKVQEGFLSERRDCAVRALALAADIPYARAHALLKAEGRRDSGGTKPHMTDKALQKTGAGIESVFDYYRVYPPPPAPTLADFIRRHRTGRYLIGVKSHALALVDGVIHDAGYISGPRCRVKRAWKVTPATPEPSVAPAPPVAAGDLSQTDINAMWERLKAIKF